MNFLKIENIEIFSNGESFKLKINASYRTWYGRKKTISGSLGVGLSD